MLHSIDGMDAVMQHVYGSDAIGDFPPLHVQLLGGFQVTVGDRIVSDAAWRTQKARGLVKLLCLAPNHQLHREQVFDLLWPELDLEAAAANLRSTVHAVRRALEPDRANTSRPCLQLRRDVLALDAEGGLEIDVETFNIAAEDAFNHRTSANYRAAISLYTGDLLPEDRYEDWAVAPRESLKETWIRLLMSLAELSEARGEYASGISSLKRVIAVDVTHEDAYAGLMRLYALSGRPGQALRQYERLKDGLAGELDVEPSVTTRRLQAEIAAGRFPAEGSVAQPPTPVSHQRATAQHNLPAPLTSFIGRRDELDSLGKLLQTSRLITLTGVGGSGKSRLALELARERADIYPDGAWLAELAALSDPTLVPVTVAAVVGVREHPEHSTLNALIDVLHNRELMLVLDNCEHLIEACASLVQALLEACPQLLIVATSREVLRVPGELNWRVPPLSLPPSQPDTLRDQTDDPEQLLKNEAIALFVDRVRWVRPTFVLTAGNAPSVAQICHRLDGLPLALELAAARASALAPHQLAERLDDALRLLSGGSRTASSRQYTLRATLDWSYDLLDSRERALLRRLAVFSGGWTLDAVEDVCAWQAEPDRSGDMAGIVESDVLTLLAQLVDKSLVQVEEAETSGDISSGVRYRLLETVRQYATARLAERGETQQSGDMHANYYLTLAEEAEPFLTSPQQGIWVGRLEREHDNLRAALRWLAQNEDVEREARLCVALLRFWAFLGYFVEGERWIADALARSDDDTPSLLLRGRLLQCAAMMAWRRGEPLRSGELSRASLPLFQKAGDRYYLAGTFHNLGAVAELQSSYAEAARHYEEALRLREEVDDKPGAANTLHNLGNLAREQGDLDGASELYERELVLQKEVGTKLGVALALSGLGVVALDKGDYELAVNVSMESHNLSQEVGGRSLNAMVIQNLGFAFTSLGEHARGLEFQNQCLRLTVETGDKRGIACGLEGVASAIAIFDTSPRGAEQSARIFGAADGLREELNVPLPPADFALMESSVSLARKSLGEELFNAAWTAGRALPLDDVIAEALAASATTSTDMPAPVSLSRREREVAALLGQGHTNTGIAAALGMARPTADKHVSNILRKLGFTSRTDVQAWAIEHGLVPDDTTSR